MKKSLIIGLVVLLMISVLSYATIQKINLPANTVLITKISESNVIANAMKDSATITLAKAKLALVTATPLIVQMVQDSISFDGVIKQDIKDEAGNIIQTIYFYKLVEPYKSVTKIQISQVEQLAKIVELQAQKTAIIAAQNKIIADEQAKADQIATAIVDEGE